MRAAHLNAVQAALEEHVTRLGLVAPTDRGLPEPPAAGAAGLRTGTLTVSRPAARGARPVLATVADLASLPMMTKQEAQEQWDTIVTAADLDRAGAERILVEQQWFSYTPDGQQIFSSGGSSGVRGVYVWDWQFFVSAACLAWRMQAREERRRNPGFEPARGAGGRCPAARQHAAVRHADGHRHGDGRDRRGCAVRRSARRGGGRATHAPGRLFVGDRATCPRALAGDLRIEPVRVSTNSEPLLDEDRQAIRRGLGRADPQRLGLNRNRCAGRRLRAR